MMPESKPSVYLDTSVINFLFADDAPELQGITQEFFEIVRLQAAYEVCISEFVVQEIQQTKDELKRRLLLNVLEEFPIRLLDTGQPEAIDKLAKSYLEKGLLPPGKFYDALHVAFCVIEHKDFLASWNYKHLANVARERRITLFNFELGHNYPLRIITPHELAGYGT